MFGKLYFKMKNLDELLSEIAKEPASKEISNAEVRFMRELSIVRKVNYEEFVRYLYAYNEVHNSKLCT